MSEFQNTLQSYRQCRKLDKTHKHSEGGRAWWRTSLIPAPWRLRQGDFCEFRMAKERPRVNTVTLRGEG